MESLEGQDVVVHAGHAVALAAQPADELETQLGREAAQVAEAHLLQKAAGVAPQHHVDVHVLGALAVPSDGKQKRRLEHSLKIVVSSRYKRHDCRAVHSYPLLEGPAGMLKVFCKLNLPVATDSAD